MSAGTREFWVVDADQPAVLVTDLTGTRTYGPGQSIASAIYDWSIAVDDIFADWA